MCVRIRDGMILFILGTKKFSSERKIIEGENEGKNSPSVSPHFRISSEQVQQGNYLFDNDETITAKVLFLFAKIKLHTADLSSSLIVFGLLF